MPSTCLLMGPEVNLNEAFEKPFLIMNRIHVFLDHVPFCHLRKPTSNAT